LRWSKRKINLGPGVYKERGYINIDVDTSVHPDIVRDVRRGLPFDSNSVDEVRAHHFLEHLEYEEYLFVLSEIYRVLKHSGILDIKVPLGVMGDISHKLFFQENSFVTLLDPKSGDYFRAGTSWKEMEKEVYENPHGCKVLHIILEAVKK